MTRRIGILGSGFGLYGYGTAMSAQGCTAVTLARYKSVIESRRDLGRLSSSVIYVEHDQEVLEANVEALVIARRPEDQFDLLLGAAGRSHLHLFLEKPVCRNLMELEVISAALAARDGTFSVGYLFPYTSWYRWLTENLSSSAGPQRIEFRWAVEQFGGHVHTRSWKASPIHGGGLAAFYAVHLIPLLRQLSLEVVVLSDEAGALRIEAAPRVDAASGKHGEIQLLVLEVFCGPPEFSVTVSSAQQQKRIGMSTPFSQTSRLTSGIRIDDRVPPLSRYMKQVLADPLLRLREELALLTTAEDFFTAIASLGARA